MQRIPFGYPACLFEIIGKEDVGPAGTVGEWPRLLEHTAGPQLVEEGKVRVAN